MYLPNSAGWRAVLATPSLLGLARNLAASCTLAFGHSAAGTTRAFSAAGAADAMPPVAAAAAAVPTRVPVERLMRAINPDVCQELRDHGFVVIDNVFGAGTAAALRAEVHALKQQGHMHKNCTHLVQGGSTGLLEKEHIHEAELMLPGTQALAPLCAQIQHDDTLRVMLSVLMPELSLHTQAIKLQWNDGSGGCFPMHFDSDTAVDSRRLTAVFYLNAWQPGDGGELRLYPFPQGQVDIAPLSDRLVLFSSMMQLHRVLPSAAPRACFTVWLSDGPQRHPGRGGGSGGAGQDREALRRALSRTEPLGAEEAWRLLGHPEIRKHAVKWFYRTEWERSIRESHPKGVQLQAALGTFWQEVAVIERALAPLLPALVAGPPAGSAPAVAWF